MTTKNYSKISSKKNKKAEKEIEAKENLVEEVKEEIKELKVGIVKCSLLNVREHANKDSKVLTVIKEGNTVTINDSDNDFYSVVTTDGIKGYCMKQFIECK